MFQKTIKVIAAVAAMSFMAESQVLAAGLDGHWKMSSVRCVSRAGNSAPKYSTSVNMRIKGSHFTVSGNVAGFGCQMSGSHSNRGSSIHFRITDDGGCQMGDYLKNGFNGTVKNNRMTVVLGTSIGEMLCDNPGSSLQVVLKL